MIWAANRQGSLTKDSEMKDIVLISLHGMGKEKPFYFSDLVDGLKKTWERISANIISKCSICSYITNPLWASFSCYN